MNHSQIMHSLFPDRNTRPSSEVAVADAAGMVWAHSNPAELYRWIARRNDLLNTVAEAFRLRPADHAGSWLA